MLTFNANAPLLTCGGLITWTSTGTLTYSVNDTQTNQCLPGDPFPTWTTKYQGSGSVPNGPALYLAFASGVGFDFNANTYAFGEPSAPVTVTITDCRGGVTTSQSSGFFGPSGEAHAGGILFKNVPLPPLVQTLNGSFTEQTFTSSTGPGISLTWQYNWSISPVQNFDFVLTSRPGFDWKTWRPTGGGTESDTGLDQNGGPNLLFIIGTLIDKTTGEARGDVLPDRVTFALKDASKEPGVAMNWPPQGQSVSAPDLTFDPQYNPPSAGYTVSSDGTSVDLDATVIGSSSNLSAVISPHDWGAWATLNVTVVVGTITFDGHFAGDSVTDILIPNRQPGSHIANIWKTQHNVGLPTPDGDDSENNPNGDPQNAGDGLSLYEEYRGFYVHCAGCPSGVRHVEGDPHKKDLFVINQTGRPEIDDGIRLFQRAAGLNVCCKTLGTDEITGDRIINFNHSQGAHLVDQHAVLIVNGKSKAAACTDTTTNAPGPPSVVNKIYIPPLKDYVGINTVLQNAGIKSANGASALTKTVAHELGHASSIWHHGEGDLPAVVYWYTPDGTRIKEIGKGVSASNVAALILGDFGIPIHVFLENGTELTANNLGMKQFVPATLYQGITQGQHGGDVFCFMRYNVSMNYVAISDPARRYVAGEFPGFYLTDLTSGTGTNVAGRSPQPRYGDAAANRGDCSKQLCVNDNVTPTPRGSSGGSCAVEQQQ